MATTSLWPFGCPSEHEAVCDIIRRRSSNTTDVRDAALAGLDLSSAREILDLGCGFGFMSEVVARRAAPDARLTGVDVWAANEGPYLERIAATGRQGRFICAQVGPDFRCPDYGYDLVVCSYSLYYFGEILPEVTRVLKPEGLFLALTHTHRSFVDLLHAAGLDENGSELLALSRRFSAENGLELLSKWFGEVTRVDYPNCLQFEPQHADELFTYLRFKLPFLIPGAQPGDVLPEANARFARQKLSSSGLVLVEKSDAAFRCRRPTCP